MNHAGTRVTRRALRAYFPDGRWTGRIQLLPQHGVVFVKNAKAGTSTILLWLHRIYTGDHTWLPQRRLRGEHQVPRPRDVGLGKAARMLDGKAFRFTFVREPVARVESAYLDKIMRVPSDYWRVEVRRVLGLREDPQQVPTFEQFVTSLELQEPLLMDPHWRPQHLNLMYPLLDYDLVGRLETFDADLERVRVAAGLPRVPIQVRNTTRREGSLFDGRPSLLRKVRDVYARDFELYGYE